MVEDKPLIRCDYIRWSTQTLPVLTGQEAARLQQSIPSGQIGKRADLRGAEQLAQIPAGIPPSLNYHPMQGEQLSTRVSERLPADLVAEANP